MDRKRDRLHRLKNVAINVGMKKLKCRIKKVNFVCFHFLLSYLVKQTSEIRWHQVFSHFWGFIGDFRIESITNEFPLKYLVIINILRTLDSSLFIIIIPSRLQTPWFHHRCTLVQPNLIQCWREAKPFFDGEFCGVI